MKIYVRKKLLYVNAGKRLKLKMNNYIINLIVCKEYLNAIIVMNL